VTSIGNSAFLNCINLVRVIIYGNALTFIDAGAFYATNLTEITIPNSLTFLGISAFRYNANLIRVNFLGNAPSIGTLAFDGTPVNLKIYRYSRKSGWSSTFGGKDVLLIDSPIDKNLQTFGFPNISLGKVSIKKQNLGGGKISLYKAKPQPKFVVFGVALLGTNLASAPVPCDFSNYNTTWIYLGSPSYRYRKIDELIYINTPLTPEGYGGNGLYQVKDSDDQYFTNSYNNTDKFPSDNWQLGNYITNNCPVYTTVPIFVLQNPNAVIFYESGSGNPLTYSGDGLSTSHFVGGLSGGGQDYGSWTVTFKIKKAGVLYYSFDLQSEASFDYAAANVNNNTIFEYQSGIIQSNGNINVNIDDIITISYSKDESVSVGFDGIQFDFYIV
jgi:hypothetical protein